MTISNELQRRLGLAVNSRNRGPVAEDPLLAALQRRREALGNRLDTATAENEIARLEQERRQILRDGGDLPAGAGAPVSTISEQVQLVDRLVARGVDPSEAALIAVGAVRSLRDPSTNLLMPSDMDKTGATITGKIIDTLQKQAENSQREASGQRDKLMDFFSAQLAELKNRPQQSPADSLREALSIFQVMDQLKPQAPPAPPPPQDHSFLLQLEQIREEGKDRERRFTLEIEKLHDDRMERERRFQMEREDREKKWARDDNMIQQLKTVALQITQLQGGEVAPMAEVGAPQGVASGIGGVAEPASAPFIPNLIPIQCENCGTEGTVMPGTSYWVCPSCGPTEGTHELIPRRA